MKSGRQRRGEPDWVHLSDEELLDWRISDLGVQIEGSPLEERLERLDRELEQRGIVFRPHYWLSDDWFSPEGVPGVAIPFAVILGVAYAQSWPSRRRRSR